MNINLEDIPKILMDSNNDTEILTVISILHSHIKEAIKNPDLLSNLDFLFTGKICEIVEDTDWEYEPSEMKSVCNNFSLKFSELLYSQNYNISKNFPIKL